MSPAKLEAARKLNELETRIKITDESISKTEDMLISARKVQAINRHDLAILRAAVADLPD